MEILIQVIQVLIALSLLLVWLVRAGKATGYRGGDAKNIREEFAVYGLPYWFMITIGVLKVGFALFLIAGLWFPGLVPVASVGIVLLMAGAVSMHIRVKDPLKKSLPALSLLVLSLLVSFYVL
jgi:hypothetical protein